MNHTMKKGLMAAIFVFTIMQRSAFADSLDFILPRFYSVFITPSSAVVNVGDTFSLAIDVRKITDLFAYEFDLYFDPSILSAKNIDEGIFLSSGGSTSFVPGVIDNRAGTISFTTDTLEKADTGVSGSGTLALITFTAIHAGGSAVGLSHLSLFDSKLTDMGVTAQDAKVSVQPVPEPSSLILLGTGLALLITMRRHALTVGRD